MMKRIRKILSILCTIAMLVTGLPVAAWSDGAEETAVPEIAIGGTLSGTLQAGSELEANYLSGEYSGKVDFTLVISNREAALNLRFDGRNVSPESCDETDAGSMEYTFIAAVQGGQTYPLLLAADGDTAFRLKAEKHTEKESDLPEETQEDGEEADSGDNRQGEDGKKEEGSSSGGEGKYKEGENPENGNKPGEADNKGNGNKPGDEDNQENENKLVDGDNPENGNKPGDSDDTKNDEKPGDGEQEEDGNKTGGENAAEGGEQPEDGEQTGDEDLPGDDNASGNDNAPGDQDGSGSDSVPGNEDESGDVNGPETGEKQEDGAKQTDVQNGQDGNEIKAGDEEKEEEKQEEGLDGAAGENKPEGTDGGQENPEENEPLDPETAALIASYQQQKEAGKAAQDGDGTDGGKKSGEDTETDETAQKGEPAGEEKQAADEAEKKAGESVALEAGDFTAEALSEEETGALVLSYFTPKRNLLRAGAKNRGTEATAGDQTKTGYEAYEISLSNPEKAGYGTYTVPVTLADAVDLNSLLTDAGEKDVYVIASMAFELYHLKENENGELQPESVPVTAHTDEKNCLTGFDFETDGFSTYILKYTVDFHYCGVDYSIPGDSQILLSELIERMQILNGDVLLQTADVAEVVFSDEHLVTVEQVSGWIVCNDGESHDAGEKDFLLSSEQAFTSEEVLTIVLNNGETITIGVTDDGVVDYSEEGKNQYLLSTLISWYNRVNPYTGQKPATKDIIEVEIPNENDVKIEMVSGTIRYNSAEDDVNVGDKDFLITTSKTIKRTSNIQLNVTLEDQSVVRFNEELRYTASSSSFTLAEMAAACGLVYTAFPVFSGTSYYGYISFETNDTYWNSEANGYTNGILTINEDIVSPGSVDLVRVRDEQGQPFADFYITQGYERKHDDTGIFNVKLNDGETKTITITGLSTSYNGNGSISVPDRLTYQGVDYPVTAVADYAFVSEARIVSLSFENTSPIEIGTGAFASCEQLQSISFDGPVGNIGQDAFNGDTALESFVSGEGDQSITIGGWAFSNCTALSNVGIGSPVSMFGQSAFRYTGLISPTFKTDNATIDQCAFSGTHMDTLTFDGTINTIAQYGLGYYYEYTSLKKLVFLGYVSTVESWAVCTGELQAVIFAGSVGSVENSAFYRSIEGDKPLSDYGDLVYIGAGNGTTVNTYSFYTFDYLELYIDMPKSKVSGTFCQREMANYTEPGRCEFHLNPAAGYTNEFMYYIDGSEEYPLMTYRRLGTFMYSAARDKEEFREKIEKLGLSYLNLPFEGQMSADGFTVHILPDNNGGADFPADFRGYGLLNTIIFEEGVQEVHLADNALTDCVNLTSVTVRNENAVVTVGKNALKGTKVNTPCMGRQTVLGDTWTLTFAQGVNAPIGTQLVMTESTGNQDEAIRQAAKTGGLFADTAESSIAVKYFDLSLAAPDGSAVHKQASVEIDQRLGVYSGSDSLRVREFGFFHLEGAEPALMTDQADQDTVTGHILYAFGPVGFSPFAAAVTTDAREASDGIYTYLVNEKNEAVITGYDTGFTGNRLDIPGETKIGGVQYKVTGIASNALQNPPETIEHIIFNNNHTLFVGAGAFSGLTDVKSIVLNGTGNVIADDASTFSGTGVSEMDVEMKNGLTLSTADDGISAVFSNVAGGIHLTVSGDKPVSIPDNAFKNAAYLQTVKITCGLTDVREIDFSYSYSDPDDFVGCAVGESAFEGCSNLTSFSVSGSGSYSIGNYAFKGTKLSQFASEGKITGIGTYAFDGAIQSESLTIPMEDGTLCKGAFDHCTALKHVTIDGDVLNFDDYIFGGTDDNATKLRSLVVTGNVAHGRFGDIIRAEQLRVLVFKNGIDQLSDDFCFTTGASETTDDLIIYCGNNPDEDEFSPNIGGGDCFPEDRTVRIYLNLTIPRDEAYGSKGLWYYSWYRHVAEAIYASDTAQEDVYVDESVGGNEYQDGTKDHPFGTYAAAAASTKTEIRNAEKFRGYLAAAGIDANALGLQFNEEPIQTTVYTLHVIRDSANIDTDVFRGDTKLTGVCIDVEGDAVIGENAFINCGNLESLEMKAEGDIGVGKSAFENCSALTAFTASGAEDLTIRENAFRNDSGLSELILGNTKNTEIDAGAFENCGAFDRILLKGGNPAVIKAGAFKGDTVQTLYLPAGSSGVENGAFDLTANNGNYVDGGETFNAELASKVGRFRNIILTGPKQIAADAQVFANNSRLETLYLGKDTAVNGGTAGSIFGGMNGDAVAYVALHQTDFAEGCAPVRENGTLRFLDDSGIRYINGKNKNANPDGSISNGFATFEQALAYAKAYEQDHGAASGSAGSGTGETYYTDLAAVLQEAYTESGIAFAPNDIRFPIPVADSDYFVFRVIGTVSIPANEEAWDSGDLSRTIVLLRNGGFTDALVQVSCGSLTLRNIVLDGDNLPAQAPLINVGAQGSLTLDSGSILRNNTLTGGNGYALGGAVYANGRVNVLEGSRITGNAAYYGGGIHMSRDTAELTMSGGQIDHNKATAVGSDTAVPVGGGVALSSSAKMIFTGGSVDHNESGGIGGGISVGAANSTMFPGFLEMPLTRGADAPRIEYNTSEREGGGMYIQQGSVARVERGYICNNTSKGGSFFSGGGVYVNGQRTVNAGNGWLYLTNVLITDNHAIGPDASGGGIATCPTADTKIYLTSGGAIYGNTAEFLGDDLYLERTDVTGTRPGTGQAYVSGTMLGGALYRWMEQKLDGSTVELGPEGIDLSATYGLNYYKSGYTGSAPAGVQVFITGNRALDGRGSFGMGGGIGSNGNITIGTPPETIPVEWKPEISKTVTGRAVPAGESFEFTLYEAVKKNGRIELTALQTVTFSGPLPENQPVTLPFEPIVFEEPVIGERHTYMIRETGAVSQDPMVQDPTEYVYQLVFAEGRDEDHPNAYIKVFETAVGRYEKDEKGNYVNESGERKIVPLEKPLTFVNRYITARLTVTKSWSGLDTATLAEVQQDANFYITLSGKDIGGSGVNTKTLLWRDLTNGSWTSGNLPVGQTYEAKEFVNGETVAAYQMITDGESASVTAGKVTLAEIAEGATDTNRIDLKNNYERNEPETGGLTVSKTVISDDAADRTKAFSFTVTLDRTDLSGIYGDMTFVNGVATFTLSDGQTAAAGGLPFGTAYTVTETTDIGFTTTSTGAAGTVAETGSAAVFTNTRRTGSLEITKYVTVNGAATNTTLADGEYTFTVTRDGQAVEGSPLTIRITNGAANTATLTGLLPGIYTVHEETPANGTQLTGGNDKTAVITEEEITVTQAVSFTNNYHVPEAETIDISGEKTWVDNENRDHTRPEKITVNLYANGTLKARAQVTAAKNWQYSFKGLDKTNEAGQEIRYTVTEDPVDGYTTVINGYQVMNIYSSDPGTLSIVKIWDDMDDLDGSRPESVRVSLRANGKIIRTVTLNAANNWSASVENLPQEEDGTAIVYTWQETDVPGYTAESETTGTVTVLTNRHQPELTERSVRKVWNDNNNEAGIRPNSLTVTLYADGKVVQTLKLTGNIWSATVNNLPVTYKGTVINYTWSEIEPPLYVQESVAVVDNTTTFTNTTWSRKEMTEDETEDGEKINHPGSRLTEIDIDDYNTALGVEVIVNHVGHCFD